MPLSQPRYLSALLSLPPTALFGGADKSWRDTFPFSAPTGAWAFSGRVALAEGLRHLGLTPGATILVPAYFQGTEIDTLLRSGYRLKFYRVKETFEIDLDDAKSKLTPKTEALYVIHYFGLPQPLTALTRFCAEHRLKLIEDCALALYSRDGQVPLGEQADLAFFSVYKSVPLPHGGYVTLRQEATLRSLPPPPFVATMNQTVDLIGEYLKAVSARVPFHRTRRVLSVLRRPLGWQRGATIESGGVVWDKRMMEYGASPLVQRLMGLASPQAIVARRRGNFNLLHRCLRRYSPLPFDILPEGANPLFYPIVVADKAVAQQDLASQGIGSVNLWSHSHSACPKELTQEVAPWRRHLLELPVHHLLDEGSIERIARVSAHYLDNRGAGKVAVRGGVPVMSPVT